ncbi:hypothetical protein ACOME3_008335 [Neoechinorhynchus agilis]
MMVEKVKLLPSWRFCVTLICASSISMMFIHRLNISYTRKCMLNTNATNLKDITTGSLNWSTIQINYLASAVLYGYAFSQIPGAMVTQYIGPYLTGAIAHGSLASIAFLFPVIATIHLYLAIFSHVLIGVSASLILSATLRIMSRWVIQSEKGILFGIFGAGPFTGILLMIPLSVESCMLASHTSWNIAFYIAGGCGLTMLVAWILCVRSHPDDHFCISQVERKYINDNVTDRADPENIPWLRIIRNKRCLGFFIAHGFTDFSTFVLILFAGDILRERSRGYHSLRETEYPFITYWGAMIICTPLYGSLFDFLCNRGYLSKLYCRRLFFGIGTLIPAAMAIALSLINTEEITGSIIVLFIWFSAIGANHGAGIYVSPMDMAPAFPDSFWSISNTLANCVGTGATFLKNALDGMEAGWKVLTYLCSGCYVIAFTLSWIFATVDEINFSTHKVSVTELANLAERRAPLAEPENTSLSDDTSEK